MIKHTSAFILSLAVILALCVYGCSSSGGGHFISQTGDVNLTSREVVINEQGRLSAAITFPSGAKIETLEANTLTPGIKVIATEENLASGSVYKGYFSDYISSFFYLYRVTAYQEPSNSVGSKAYVTTTEKPFRITIPKISNNQGVVLAGIKESDSDPWRYFSLSEDSEVSANIAGVRLSHNSSGEYAFEIFRLGARFSLMIIGDSEMTKLPETMVTSLTASSTSSIAVKDGKYLEDLRIKGILKGAKLDSIKPTDLRARITYRNNMSDEASIKVNGANIVQYNKDDKTIPSGNTVHSFEVDSISGYKLNSSTGEYSFILNLNGIETNNFPNSFLIEFFNKNSDSEKIMPYYYSEFCSFETHEKQDEPEPQPAGAYSITYNLDGGSVTIANPTGYNTASETFTLNEPTKEGYTFIGWTGSNGDVPQMDVSVEQGSIGNKLFTANYELITYTIAYELDGGQTAVNNPTSYDVTSSTIILNNPTKEGSSFVGWTGSNGNTPQAALIIEKGSTGNRTYIASYTTASYVISYNLDGGTVTPANPTGYDTASETFTLNEPTKEGYTFIGWTGSNGDVPQTTVSIGKGSKSDRTYTANYIPITYNITYELNGGIWITANPEKYDITSATIKLNNPTREGYSFTGWTSVDMTTPEVFAIVEKGSHGNKTFNANWSINSYKLTLNKGTGIAGVTGDGMHQYGSPVIASCTILDGYEFDYWTGNNGVAVFDMPSRDVEMQANARLKTYSIDCRLNGGDVAAPNRTNYNLLSENITLVNPTREGYTFDGWTGSNGNTPQTEVTISTGSTGDKTYTANFSVINYRIRYYTNGGEVTGNPENYDVTTEDFVLINPTKDEFRFIGWTGSNGDEPQTTVTIEQGSTGDKVFSANYVQAANTITYNLNGGTNHPDNPHGFNPASATFTLKQPSKLGHVFTGWTGSNGDVPQMIVTIESGSTDDRIYTAHFEEVPYTITYLMNGGTNNPLNPSGYAAYTPTFTLYEPTRPGYDFTGWTEGAATFPIVLTEIPRNSTGDKVFTAHWIESITFTLPGGVPLIMNKCPAGTFIMGSPDEELGRDFEDSMIRESPQHQVTISKAFYIGKFEVTQEQYEAVMGTNPSYFSAYADSPSRPVECVNWDNARNFCASLTTYLSSSIPDGFSGFDLPSEAQWEYACRAGTTTSLNNGTNISEETGVCNNLSALGWYVSISNSQTHPVGQKQSNVWGLYDMHGNVWEWCLDKYKQTYYQDCGISCVDPTGPDNGTSCVLRGGRWSNNPRGCRSAYRGSSYPTNSDNGFGFRLSLVPNP